MVDDAQWAECMVDENAGYLVLHALSRPDFVALIRSDRLVLQVRCSRLPDPQTHSPVAAPHPCSARAHAFDPAMGSGGSPSRTPRAAVVESSVPSARPLLPAEGLTSRPRILPRAYWFSPVARVRVVLVYVCGLLYTSIFLPVRRATRTGGHDILYHLLGHALGHPRR
jgi:hypothetical protein